MTPVHINYSPVIDACELEQFANLQYASPDRMRDVQNHLCTRHIAYAAEHSPFYRTLFQSHNIDPASITGVDCLPDLPFTTKTDMEKFNDQFLAVNERDIIDVCLTSATTRDTPIQLMQTRSDLARLAYNEHLAFEMAGVTAADTMLICASMERCFMAGLAYFLGGIKLGAKVVRCGSGSAAQIWNLITSHRVSILTGVPSLMLKTAVYAMEKGEDPSAAGVRRIIAIGEGLRDERLNPLPLAERLENMWGAAALSTYASTELATAFCECEKQRGGHCRPELVVVEIIDDQGVSAKTGQLGEVVVTPLGVAGMPLVRFRSGDVSFLTDELCLCGRTTPRLGPIIGRRNQMMKYKGTTLFPQSILSVVFGIDGISGGCVEVGSDSNGYDRIIVYIACESSAVTPDIVREQLRARLRVSPEINMISSDALMRKTTVADKRKPLTFLDKRKTP